MTALNLAQASELLLNITHGYSPRSPTSVRDPFRSLASAQHIATRGGYLRDIGHFGGVAGGCPGTSRARAWPATCFEAGRAPRSSPSGTGGAGDRLGAVPKPLGSEPSLNESGWVLCFRQMQSKAVASAVLI